MRNNEVDIRRNHQDSQHNRQRIDGELLADSLLRIIGGDDAPRATSREGIQSEENHDDRNRKDTETLEQFAKGEGLWIENADEYLRSLYGKHFAQGSESFVYRIDKQTIIKTRSFIGYDTIANALNSIKIHNLLFPETALKRKMIRFWAAIRTKMTSICCRIRNQKMFWFATKTAKNGFMLLMVIFITTITNKLAIN